MISKPTIFVEEDDEVEIHMPSLQHRWDLMEVGDSLQVVKLSSCASAKLWGRNHGKKFTSRKQSEEPRGWRVWRVA